MSDTSASEGYLTEERLMIQESAREFTRKEVAPVAFELDPVEGLIPDSIRKQMGELGYFGILIPEKYGGLGLGAFEYCIVAEELARGWMSVASLLARGNGFYKMVPGDGEVREERIRKMATGEYLGAFAMSEPNAGSDVAAISCMAKRDGDEWVITGNKYWCTFADGSDFIYAVVRTEKQDDQSSRHVGLTGIAIDKPRGELPKNVHGSPIPKIGYHGWKTFELAFDGLRVPVYGDEKQTGKPFMRWRQEWKLPEHIQRLARSGWPKPRSKTPLPMPKNAYSSGGQSRIFKRSVSRWRPWLQRSRRHAN